jgi:hypothetical protein
MRVVGSQALVYNPLPGVGLVTGLTHLVARSNYGINRCGVCDCIWGVGGWVDGWGGVKGPGGGGGGGD